MGHNRLYSEEEGDDKMLPQTKPKTVGESVENLYKGKPSNGLLGISFTEEQPPLLLIFQDKWGRGWVFCLIDMGKETPQLVNAQETFSRVSTKNTTLMIFAFLFALAFSLK